MSWMNDDAILAIVAALVGLLAPLCFWLAYQLSPFGRAERQARERQELRAEIERLLAECETPARYAQIADFVSKEYRS